VIPILALLALLVPAPPDGEGAAATPPPSEHPPASPAAAEPPPEEDPSDDWATPLSPEPGPARPPPITLLFNLGAYYTSAGLYLPLTSSPTPNVGEQGEAEIYGALLRRALQPRDLVLEASLNPMPCLGLAAHEWNWGYRRADVPGDLNLVRVLTAGFQEPFAVSVFLGNVADYQVPGRDDVHGRGYLGLLVSGGLFHLVDNTAVEDRWLEAELKLKGDRNSEEARLSWSFRGGVKLHSSRWVADHGYLGLRRSRVDAEGRSFLLDNSGVEYRFDLSLQGRPLRHFFLVDKKWPLGRGRVALVLGAGVLWESGAAYRGPLAERAGRRFQALLRPNVVF
jgi:hypothetical protein